MALSFTRVTETDAELLLKWRTDPDIAKHMLSSFDNPSLEKQQQWVRSLKDRKDYRAYIIRDMGNPIGFVAFSDIDSVNQRCSPGLYIYDKVAGLKYAVTVHYYISSYIFRYLKCNKLTTQVLADNKKALKIQALKKSRLVGCLKQHIFKDNGFHDVFIFEALKQDWEKETMPFNLEHFKEAFDDWED